MKKKFPTLSVCMIVKDEEENLPTLLASIKGLANEVIVVDTGSKDDTVRIARDFGARVYHFPWRDDFSAARNESLKHATKDFILWLDGDDEVKRGEHQKIRAHLRRHPGTGAYLRTYVEGEGQAQQLRILPNHRGIRFEGRIHEQAIHCLEAKGIPAYRCDAAIIHHGYEKPGALVEKLRRNRKILEEELDERPGDVNTIFFLARTCLGLGETDEALVHLDAVIERGKDDHSARAQTAFNLALLDKGQILAALGRVEEALSVLSYGKSLFPGFALIRYLLGKVRFERKEYGEAFGELLPLKDETFEGETTPIDVSHMRKWLHRSLGVSALFVDNFAVAEECFVRAIEGEPSDRAAYHHLAVARERKGDVEGAIAACRLGLERVGDDGYLTKRLFFLLLKKEAFGQALECYESMNGGSMDVDALSGRFLLSCRALDAAGIQSYYRLLQGKLSIEPLDFPQNLQVTKNRLKESSEVRSLELFDSAIAFLLAQTP
jgi:glycosyltransferase involved in cell wall biosynthesis